MKTTIDKLAHKYALNIKQIRGPGSTKIADFKNLNKNFYDDIESNNITLKDDTKQLNKIKSYSIKEFIYTNRVIPNIWKKKINYQDEILDVISKDKKLLSYIGSSKIQTKKNSLDKFPKINTRYDASKSVKSRNIEDIHSEKEMNSMNNIINNNSNNNINNSIVSSPRNREIKNEIKNKYSIKKKGQLSEKEINTLMDDYKTAYPIKEKLKELYITSNYYNTNKNKNETVAHDLNQIDENQLINTKKTYNSIDTSSLKNPRHTFNHTNKKLITKKQKTFRQNIFNNLSPSIDNTFYSFNKNLLNRISKINKRKINIYNENKNGKDISKMNEVSINHPIVKKSIESINYYGPYSSFCPSCLNRNLEYYNKMEPNQCIGLIHFIKKVRHKNDIMNIKRTSSIVPNKKTSFQKETLESDNDNNFKGDNTEAEKLDNFI